MQGAGMGEKGQIGKNQPKKSSAVEVGGHVGSLRLLENGAPRYELRIDREGRWFHEGVEIVRDDIRSHFSQHLARNKDGGYVVRIGNDECPVVVEDAPFVVSRVVKEPNGGFSLLLSDCGAEPLDVKTLEFKESNIPYCRVRNGLEARFSRPAYYQLAEFIEYNEETDRFEIVVSGHTVTLDAP